MVVLVALVNIGMPKLWLLLVVARVDASGKVTLVLPVSAVVNMLPPGLLATKFTCTLEFLSESNWSLKSGGVEFLTMSPVINSVSLSSLIFVSACTMFRFSLVSTWTLANSYWPWAKESSRLCMSTTNSSNSSVVMRTCSPFVSRPPTGALFPIALEDRIARLGFY
jgi:hypothetical protein